MENRTVGVWYPRVNDTVAIQIEDKQLLGTFEGNLAVEKTIPNSIPDYGLVRFIKNEYENYKDFMSQFECYNKNSKFSRLCAIPLDLIKEKDRSNNGQPVRKTPKAA